MMTVQLAKRLITADEYYTMAKAGILTAEDRVELIHGEILEMSPIGSKHAAVVNNISNRLMRLIGETVIISVQNPIRINDLNEPEPDISVLKLRKDYYQDNHPSGQDVLLVIEVSDTTYSYDKEVKLPLYSTGGVPEYWIINLPAQQIEVHTKPSNGLYKKMQIFNDNDSIPIDFCESEVKVEQLIG